MNGRGPLSAAPTTERGHLGQLFGDSWTEGTVFPLALPQVQKKSIFSPSKLGQAVLVLVTAEPA